MSDGDSRPAKPRSGGSLADGIRHWLRSLTGSEAPGSDEVRLEDLLEAFEDRPVEPEQREMLLNILSFNERQVDDVMVPRPEIDAVEISLGLPELVDCFRTARHSRLPVYRETLDDIVGFVHIKDVVDYWGSERPFEMKTVLRDAMVVPPSMRALDLLARMRQTRIHMAIVVDEYGGTDGLVTIEDVLEEIVGEIVDEHEQEEIGIREMPDGTYEVDARTEIDEFTEYFGAPLPVADDEDIETLAGLVFSRLGRIPRPGEVLALPELGLDVEVTEVDPRRIRRLRIRRRPGETEIATGG